MKESVIILWIEHWLVALCLFHLSESWGCRRVYQFTRRSSIEGRQKRRLPCPSVIFARNVQLCYGFTMRLGEYLLNDIKAADTIPYRPEYIHPFASAIDLHSRFPRRWWVRQFIFLHCASYSCTYLQVVLLTKDKPPYVRLPEGNLSVYKGYPPDSLEGWHRKNDLYKE
jgi:hypothetical protein